MDIDEVLVGTVSHILQYHNEVYKTNFKFQDIKDYDFWKLWGGTKEEAIKKVYGFYASSHFKELKPFPEAIESINILRKEHELIIVTARQADIKEATYNWINAYFPNSFSAIHFADDYEQIMGKKYKRKSSICEDSGIELMLEDHPNCALECANCGINTILFSKAWNAALSHEKIIRTNSWPEALGAVKQLSQNL